MFVLLEVATHLHQATDIHERNSSAIWTYHNEVTQKYRLHKHTQTHTHTHDQRQLVALKSTFACRTTLLLADCRAQLRAAKFTGRFPGPTADR